MKLIDLLVKELPRRGGWPDGVTHIGQDYDRELRFYGRGEPRTGIILDELAVDHRKIGASDKGVTKSQYDSALAASDGWIEWHGGECPVDSDAIVEVRYRKTNPYQYNNDRAGDFYWAHTGSCGDIIAYRVHDQSINSRANDDRLEQDLNDCIGQDVAAEWDGEGLPPVGVECEYSLNSGRTWFKCKIDYILGTQGLVMLADVFAGGQWVSFHEYDGKLKFRPLRTEYEKEREAAETAMRTCLAGTGAGITPMAAKGIYEAIAAGKIPGVKLEGK